MSSPSESATIAPVATSLPKVTTTTTHRIKKQQHPTLRRQLNETQWTLWNWYRHIQWSGVLVTLVIPLTCAYAAHSMDEWDPRTLKFTVVYYMISMTSMVAGYHRLWAHRAFQASWPVRVTYAMLGGTSGLGSIKWWASMHRAHHRYVDTQKDPHTMRKGIWWTHIGWLLFKPHVKVQNAIKESTGDDLDSDTLVQWQDENYLELLILMGAIFPMALCGLLWGDFLGGLIFGGVLRAVMMQHSLFLVNSWGHLVGTRPYDDKRSMRNNWLLSFFSWGEGSNNFHHEFSADYRNGIHWYDFDPVKWHLYLLSMFGLVSNLYRTSDSSISQCLIQQHQKTIDRKRAQLNWGIPIEQLPTVSPEEFRRWAREAAPERALIAVAGIVHDVAPFMNDHPGGIALLKSSIGKDATSAFNGAVYDHTTAAHNLLATMRIAVLSGGTEQIVWKQQQQENKDVPVKQDSEGRKIVRTGEQATIMRKPVRTADAA